MEVGGAAVLVVEVVSVLPDIEGEEGLEVVSHGVVGASVLGNGQLTGGIGLEPNPSTAEEGSAFLFELGFEDIYTTPLLLDLSLDFALQFGAARGELREIEVVVQDLSGVIEDGSGGGPNNLLKGFVFPLSAGKDFIQVVHVGLEVLAMVEGQSVGADNRFECVKRIWEGDEFKHYINCYYISHGKHGNHGKYLIGSLV